MDYKQTLLLPQTDFPMRANLGQKEPQWVQHWQAQDLYGQIRQARAQAPLFWLHDGPPYANGKLHHGHMLNKILKDMVLKDRTMAGMNAPYVPGWDCHGLPIETQVEKNNPGSSKSWSKVERHQHCREYAKTWVEIQRETFVRLGLLGQFDAPYLTMNPGYQASILRVFAKLVEQGLVYRGLRPVHWCPNHQTALAEAEVIYQEKQTPSAYVVFPLEGSSQSALGIPSGTGVLIWTTTPWTLPGNQAVAVLAEATYQVVQTRLGPCLMATDCLPACQQEGDLGVLTPVGSQVWLGSQLAAHKVHHPLSGELRPLLTAEFVTLDTGTGCVHIAPAHGEEDFQLGQKHQLPIAPIIDSRGCMVESAHIAQGLPYFKANPLVLAALDGQGRLLSPPTKQVQHRSTHCWRCQQPVMFRATKQWFVHLDKAFGPASQSLREQALARLQEVVWVPSWGANRIGSMLAHRPDWCISRQRIWGVPIGVALCKKCDTPILSPALLEQVAEQFAQHGAQWWFEGAAEKLYQGQTCPQCHGQALRLESDILDVWFDSGVSFTASAGQERSGALALQAHRFPVANVVIEGSDQHRGWFHSSLLLAQAAFGQAPYQQVVTHGFVVDGQGKKLSKSAGNGIDPYKALEQDGADMLRLWVASLDFRDDVRLSEEILTRQRDAYRKLRNTLRFILGNLHQFVPERDVLPAEACLPFERSALLYLMEQGSHIEQAMANFRFHEAISWLIEYCGGDLSACLCDVLKDRLYASPLASVERRSAQTVLWWIGRDLLRWLAPVLSFTCEEAWQSFPKLPEDGRSVHLLLYPSVEAHPLRASWHKIGKELHHPWRQIYEDGLQLRQACNKAIEQARQEGALKTSSQASVHLSLPPGLYQRLLAFDPACWVELCQVAALHFEQGTESQGGIGVEVRVPETLKCPRCWRHRLPEARESANVVCQRCQEALA